MNAGDDLVRRVALEKLPVNLGAAASMTRAAGMEEVAARSALRVASCRPWRTLSRDRLVLCQDGSSRLVLRYDHARSSATPDPTRRNERSRRAILATTIALIAEFGYDQVPIEAIAKRAGVGKQTIYRWWPSKGAVVLEALDESLATVVLFPDTGDIVEDLRTHMKSITQLLNSTQIGPLIQGLIAASQSDPTLSRAHLAKVIEPATVAWHDRITHAQDSGELCADADPQAIIEMLFGAMYLRLLLHTRPPEPEQIDAASNIGSSTSVRPLDGAIPGGGNPKAPTLDFRPWATDGRQLIVDS